MQLLGSAITGATFSSVFRTTLQGNVWSWLHEAPGVTATIGSVGLWCSTSQGGTYEAYTPAGTAVAITAEGTYVLNLPGGLFWKFKGDGSTDVVVIHIDGPHIELV